MITEKELLKFDEDVFTYSTYLKLNQYKDANDLKIQKAIKHAKQSGFEVVENFSEYGNNNDFGYEEGRPVVTFQKNNVKYYIDCRGNKCHTSLNEDFYFRYINKLYENTMITEEQLKLFKKAYYFTLKINLEEQSITPLFEDSVEDGDLQKDFFMLMKKEINFSKKNQNLLKLIKKEDFEIMSHNTFDLYKTISNFCGLYYFNYNSWFDITIRSSDICAELEGCESYLNDTIYFLNDAEDFFNED